VRPDGGARSSWPADCPSKLIEDGLWMGSTHAELRWRIELPALHAVYENDTGAIRQRVEVSVAKEEIGLSLNFIGPHSERERVALDLVDSIVAELSWCARAGPVSTGRSHRLHRRRDPQLP